PPELGEERGVRSLALARFVMGPPNPGRAVRSANTTRRRYAAEDEQRSALLPALRSGLPVHSVARRLGSLRDPA
ncbi:hypothetical protein, partial [Streptomyces sp. NPDC052179]|uniref:hypothetical protein n=1 Tax=Streptomyces sp. NPDC052179 TaxID=3155680 RepID=UPI0034271C7F